MGGILEVETTLYSMGFLVQDAQLSQLRVGYFIWAQGRQQLCWIQTCRYQLPSHTRAFSFFIAGFN